MDLKLYALIKNMVKGITKGDKGERGESGLLRTSAVNPYEGLTLFCNTVWLMYFDDNDVNVLAPAFDFDHLDYEDTPADKSHERQIGIIFTMRDNLTVGFPEEVHWAAAEPVFEAGKTYMLSFIPYDDIIIGVWAVVE